jgi:hypothetical protein
MKNARAKELIVTDLDDGVYQFRVVVTGSAPPAQGEGFGNVTVLPREFTYNVHLLNCLVLFK